MRDELLSDTDLDALVASATPYDDEAVAWVGLDAAEGLVDGIVDAHPPARDVVALPVRRPARGGRRLLAAAAAVVAVVGVSFVATDVVDRESNTAWSAEMVEFAESTPRLLPSGPWTVDDVEDREGGWAEMNLTDGDRLLEINWFPADELDGYIADRAADAAATLDGVQVLGVEATAHAERPEGTYSALFLHGDRGIEVRAYEVDEAEYRTLLAGIREVGVDEWLGALPPGTIAPGERAAVIDEMLRDIPLPPGVDLDRIRDADRAANRHSLGMELTTAVACGWGDVWTTATESGDTATVEQANAAMASSYEWPILHELFEESGVDDVWRLADAMPDGTATSGGGLEITVQQLLQETCVPQ